MNFILKKVRTFEGTESKSMSFDVLLEGVKKKNQATRTPWYLSAGPFQNFRRASPSFFTWETPPVPGTLIPAGTTINLSPWVAA